MLRPTVIPCLWFDSQAEEAANYYVSIFPDSRVKNIVRMPPGGPGPEGTALVVEFEVGGLPVTALNGGPVFQFNEAISLTVDCRDQAEVDEYWRKLSEGGQPGQCGWLKDRYGLSWQIVPSVLPKLMSSGEPQRVGRVMQALMQMTRLEIEKLQAAYDGPSV
jgi:predicted 3-demethylubiquinone-9 3-methyltransferase (glyoxalase superfamily)